MNKTNNKVIAEHIIAVFRAKWEEIFIIDTIIGQEISYKLFFTYVLCAKNFFSDLEQTYEKKIGLILENCYELSVFYFAALVSDIVIIPIDPEKSKHEIEQILHESHCKFVLTTNTEEIHHDDSIHVLRIDNIDFQKYYSKGTKVSDLDIFYQNNYSSLFSISFTSGTTGVPKGVMHSFQNLYNSALAFINAFNFNKKNIFYHNLPMTYMAGMLNLLFLPFLSYSQIIIGKRFQVNEALNFWEIPIKYNINTFFFIPSIISLLVKIDRSQSGIDYAKETKITACSVTAPLPEKLRHNFEKKYNLKLFNSYGLSETLFVTTNSPKLERIEGVGKPLQGVNIYLSHDNEVLINVPWAFLGYANFKTNDVYFGENYLSGDIGSINSGYLTITERKKDLIIKGGINISPKKIRDVLVQFVNPEYFVLIGIFDEILGEKVACFFINNVELDKSKQKEINNYLISQLGKDYKIDMFQEVEKIPYNLNGKVDSQKLKQLYAK